MPTEAPAPLPSSNEYVLDTAYARNYTTQLAPPLLRLVAAFAAVRPPPFDDFDYCELGSGTGDTLCILAAANPRARFWGIDFNLEHVEFARGLAARGGLTNVTFLDRNFDDLPQEKLPEFDFMAAHGVLSWISPARRSGLFAFARSKLKPGGLLLASYNAMPGWAAIEPLRRMMLDASASLPEGAPTMDRARAGFQLLEKLVAANAAYFTSHPTARSMVRLMQRAGLSYVSHEYFHAYFQPMYFADMAREVGAHGLSFVGQLPLHLNVRDLALPPQVKDIVKDTQDRVAFESIKDFATNEMFRSDVYVSPPAHRGEAAMRDFFEQTPFGALTSNAFLKRQARLPSYTLSFTGGVYDALIPAVASHSATALELSTRADLASFGARRIGDCLQNLTLGGQVVPMRPWPKADRIGPSFAHCLPYNAGAVTDAVDGKGPLTLASPVTGAGVMISRVEAICLKLLTDVAPADRPAFLRGLGDGPLMPLTVGDKVIKEPEKLVRALTKELDGFVEGGAPKLLELGILESV